MKTPDLQGGDRLTLLRVMVANHHELLDTSAKWGLAEFIRHEPAAPATGAVQQLSHMQRQLAPSCR